MLLAGRLPLVDPAMVEHSRQVTDAIGLLRNSEHEVVLLGALETVSESSEFFYDVLANNARAADIWDREEHVWRPVRLEYGVRGSVTYVHGVLVTVDYVGFGVLEKLHRSGKRLGHQLIPLS